MAFEQGVEAERMATAGFLAHVLKEHRKLERATPAVVTRKQLLESGLLLQCKATSGDKNKGKAGGGFIHWFSQQDAMRKSQGKEMNKEPFARSAEEKAKSGFKQGVTKGSKNGRTYLSIEDEDPTDMPADS